MNTQELQFAYQIKQALDENAQRISPSTAERLASARKLAVSRKKRGLAQYVHIPRHVFAGQQGSWLHEPANIFRRIGVAIPLMIGALTLVGLYQYEQEQRIAEMAEIDVALLSDELPVTAYADQGFNAYLKRDE